MFLQQGQLETASPSSTHGMGGRLHPLPSPRQQLFPKGAVLLDCSRGEGAAAMDCHWLQKEQLPLCP